MTASMFTRLARILGPTILLAACGAETPPEPVVSSIESVEPRPERAAELARTTSLDLLMVRYNAAHPGAEADIFPSLPEGRHSVVAYTATCWRRLLKRPRGWEGAVPTALALDVNLDKGTYLPGEQATLQIDVTDQDGGEAVEPSFFEWPEN